MLPGSPLEPSRIPSQRSRCVCGSGRRRYHTCMVPRRTFLFTAGGAVLSYAAPPADQVTLGVIGAGGRGTLVMTTFQKDATVRVVAICDVYEPNLETAASVAGSKPKLYRNYQHLLADRDIP